MKLYIEFIFRLQVFIFSFFFFHFGSYEHIVRVVYVI